MAHIKDTRLPKCLMLGELVGGADCVGGQEKEWMGCFLDDLRAFSINADQWMTAAQAEGEWRRTAEQGAEHFTAKWIVAEEATAGLRRAVVCPNVTGRAKERIAQSKRARAVCFWTISELSASTPTSGRLQPRTRGNGAERRNISWRNGSLQRKPRLDYGVQSCART